MRPIRMTRFFMEYLRGLNSAEPPADEHHRQGQRPGPAPNSCEGNPKARSGAASPQGLHGPLLLGCGQGLALQGSSANEGRFRQVRPSGCPAKAQPVSLGPFGRTCSHPPAPAAAGIAYLDPRSMPVGDAWVTRGRASPSPSSAMRYGSALGQMRKLEPAGGQGSPLSIGTLSARASRGLARPDSRRRPRRSPRPWQASAHRGRCQAA